VRVDAGYAAGSVVSTSYDAMLAKVIAWAPTRAGAARRLSQALRSARIHGVTTNRDLLVGILGHDEFLSGMTDTGFLDRHDPAALAASVRAASVPDACVAAAIWQRSQAARTSPLPAGIPPGWRNVGPADQPRSYLAGADTHVVRVTGPSADPLVELDGASVEVSGVVIAGGSLTAEIDGRHVRCELEHESDRVYVDGPFGSATLVEVPRLRVPEAEEAPGSMHAPLPGAVRRVSVSQGDTVAAGDVLMVLEAMKMEHAIRAPHDGAVTAVLVSDGDQVDGGAVLVVVLPSQVPSS